MEHAFDGAMILLVLIAICFLAIVTFFAAVLVISTIPKRDRNS